MPRPSLHVIKWCMILVGFFSLHPVRWYSVSVWPISENFHFHYLIKVVFTRVPYYRVVIFSFITNNTFGPWTTLVWTAQIHWVHGFFFSVNKLEKLLDISDNLKNIFSHNITYKICVNRFFILSLRLWSTVGS